MKLYTKEETSWVEISIQKWERIVNGFDVDRGTDNCELCKKYFYGDIHDGIVCDGCPIDEFVGISECRKTPYINWLHSQPIGSSFIFQNTNDITQKTAEAELEFLKMIKLYTIKLRKFI